MVEAKTKFICNGSSEVEAHGARAVQRAGAGAGQGKDRLFFLDTAAGLCVGPGTATHPLQLPCHPWQEAPSQSLEAKR